MRVRAFPVLMLVSLPVFAYDYPVPDHPNARALVERFKQDKALFAAADFFSAPAAPAWPCNVPETTQYKLAGLIQAHPELRGEFEKEMRKHMRQHGLSSDMLPQTTYSNVQIVPIKARCVGGALDGEYEFLVSYEKRDESTTKTQFGTDVVTGKTVITVKVQQRQRGVAQNGERAGEMTSFARHVVQIATTYDHPQMQAAMQKNNETLGLGAPTTTQIVIYSLPDRSTATFSESEEKQVSGGLFGVSVTPTKVLMTTFMLPVDERRKQMTSYRGKQLVSRSGMKDDRPHGEQVMYMENYLKKLNLRLDQQPGMENAREVTIDGVDLIEKRTCMQNGMPMKISPCPEG